MAETTPILVVDDDAEFRAMVTGILERSHFTTITADGGRAAIQLLEQRRQQFGGNARVRLILSDWDMPNGDGVELLRAVRAGANWALPFVLISGLLTREQLVALAKEGADAILLKPFNVTTLFQQIDTAVANRALKIAERDSAP